MEMQLDWDHGGAAGLNKAHKIIAVISMVYGSLMLLCTCAGVVMMPAEIQRLSQLPGAVKNPLPAHLMPGSYEYLISALYSLLDIMLIIAGSMLLRARARARQLHIIYACTSIMLFVLILAVNLGKMQERQELQEWLQSTNPEVASMMTWITTVTLFCGVILAMSYPLFLLVWFVVLGKGKELTQAAETAKAFQGPN